MSRSKPTKRIPSSLTDRIATIEAQLDSKAIEFCYLVASGASRSGAFVQAFGFVNYIRTNRMMDLLSPTGQLIALLREETSNDIGTRLHMDKGQRIEHLLATALHAQHRYLNGGVAPDGAIYLKAMSIINTMTGDNAPTEVHHLVSVSAEQLDRMSDSERTEAYKRMMSGKLKIIGEPLAIEPGRLVDATATSRVLPAFDGISSEIENDQD